MSKAKIITTKYPYIVDVKQVEAVLDTNIPVAEGMYVCQDLKEVDTFAKACAQENPGTPIFVYKVIKVYQANAEVTVTSLR